MESMGAHGSQVAVHESAARNTHALGDSYDAAISDCFLHKVLSAMYLP